MIVKKVLLSLPKTSIDKPIISELVRKYDLTVNIFRAKITPEEEGYLALDLSGEHQNLSESIEYLRSVGIKVDETNKGMVWNMERCVHCGSCIPHCPTKALHITSKDSMAVGFNANLCIECLSCIEICPFSVCSSIFQSGK